MPRCALSAHLQWRRINYRTTGLLGSIMNQESLLKIARNIVLVVTVTTMIAACGGGGGSVAPMPLSTAQPIPSPTGASVLSTRSLKGAAGFVNSAGFTVYVFDKDLTDPGHSTCNGNDGCTQNWPPVRPPSGVTLSGQFATITRDDGTTQLTFAGRPLYTFVVDTAPGQTNGDGVNAFGAIWHIARPQSNATPGPSPTPQPTHSPY